MALSKFYFLLLIFLSCSIYAQSADLELDAYMESSNSVYFGFEGVFSVTVKNNGPDDAERPGTTSPLMSLTNNDYTFTPDNSIVQDDCLFSLIAAEPRPPSFDGGDILLITTSPILVGESITCYGRYFVGFQQGTREALWRTFGFGQGVIDPVAENDIVIVTLGIQPIQVDALSNFSFMLLVLVVMFLGIEIHQGGFFVGRR